MASRVAQPGDTVLVHYTGRFPDGTVFGTSRGREPLAFRIGAGRLLRAVEESVVGMRAGERRTRALAAAEAYGPRREGLRVRLARDRLPSGPAPQVGDVLELMDGGGGLARVTVAEVADDAVVLDGNHPLAGKDLVFDVELVGFA